LRLGTKLTLYLTLLIVVVLSGYGYFHVVSRRDILIKKMTIEVRSIGQALKISLEKISLLREKEYVQDLINTIEEDEKTLGIIVYLQGKDFVLCSRSLNGELDPYLKLINRSIQEDRPIEEFGSYKQLSIFSYTVPFKDKKRKNIGGLSILQHTSFLKEDIQYAKWTISIIILILIGGTVATVLLITRRSINRPIAQLIDGIKRMAGGDLNTKVDMRRGDELSELAHAFNQMAIDLKGAQRQLIQEADAKLELERNLRQSEKLATIGQLASELAHEIGTPLNIIGGRAEMTRRKLEDKITAQKNLDTIILQTERITKIIQRLLGFARKKRPEQVLLSVSALLGNTIDFVDQQIQKQNVQVVKHIEENLPLSQGDPDQLQQVFLNLILNAVQSMPNGGELHLSISSKKVSRGEGLETNPEQYVEVRVEDTGIGMESEVVENIFTPFFTTKEKGTGLGLTVSNGIVQDHGGWIDVESTVGKGSVFKVYLPAVEKQAK
jgi:signal transduction histidine kinase